MPSYSEHEYELKMMIFDGEKWRNVEFLRYIPEYCFTCTCEADDKKSNYEEVEQYDVKASPGHCPWNKKEREKKVVKNDILDSLSGTDVAYNEQFEKDLIRLKDKLRDRFYKQGGYLNIDDILDIMNLKEKGVDASNRLILYTGDKKVYKEHLERIGLGYYRNYRRTGISSNGFLQVNEALDELEKNA